MNRQSPSIFFYLILLSLFSSMVSAQTLYVSDELKIPLRSGDTNQHRIVKFLKSGAPLEVQETNEAGTYYRVVTGSGKEGWVEAKDVMQQASARSRLPVLQNKISDLKQQLNTQKSSIKTLKAEIRDLQQQNAKLDDFGQRKTEDLARLKKLAARPVALAQKNKELEGELSKVRSELAYTTAENDRMKNDEIKQWFMIGGGVSLISLFFGLIIPNFKWRRKTDSWGGDF